MGNGTPKQVLIEGYTPEEILLLPDEQLEAFVFTGEPLIFRAGTAQILGEFRLNSDRLTVELAQIDGGGEGVLPTLVALAERFARKRTLVQLEWIIHAINCATPNLKLRRLLERRGFVIADVPKIGQAYHKLQDVSEPMR
jgi:hypothetical protein